MKRLILILILLISYVNALTLPKDFKSDFIQTINSNGKKLIYKGELFYKNGKILWKYTYPVEKYIWINDKVYVYEPNLMQVTISKKPKFNLENIIKKAKKEGKFYVAKIDNKKVYFIYDKTLKSLHYKDDAGNLVTIVFSKTSTKPLKDSIFIPTYPQDVDIIYQK